MRPIVDAHFSNHITELCHGVNIFGYHGLNINTISEMRSPEALSELTPLGRIVDRDLAAKIIVSCKLRTLGLDVSRDTERFEPIVSSLGLFLKHAPAIYEDLCTVSDFSAVVGNMMKLPEDAVSDLRLAGFLHDIGKIPRPEIANIPVYSHGEKMTTGEAIAKLYSDRKLLNGRDETIGAFINRDLDVKENKSLKRRNFTAAEKEMMQKAVEKWTGLKPDGKMVDFFDLHAIEGEKDLKGRVPDRAYKLASLHHIFSGVNPKDLRPTEEGAAFQTALECLVASDQVDAKIRRENLSPKNAIEQVEKQLNRQIEQRETLKPFRDGRLKQIFLDLWEMFRNSHRDLAEIYPDQRGGLKRGEAERHPTISSDTEAN